MTQCKFCERVLSSTVTKRRVFCSDMCRRKYHYYNFEGPEKRKEAENRRKSYRIQCKNCGICISGAKHPNKSYCSTKCRNQYIYNTVKKKLQEMKQNDPDAYGEVRAKKRIQNAKRAGKFRRNDPIKYRKYLR